MGEELVVEDAPREGSQNGDTISKSKPEKCDDDKLPPINARSKPAKRDRRARPQLAKKSPLDVQLTVEMPPIAPAKKTASLVRPKAHAAKGHHRDECKGGKRGRLTPTPDRVWGGARELLIDGPPDTSGTIRVRSRGRKKKRSRSVMDGGPLFGGRCAAARGERVEREVFWEEETATMRINVKGCGTKQHHTKAEITRELNGDHADDTEREMLLREIAERRSAAVVIQRRARGNAARVRVQERKEQITAVENLQRVARGRQGRKRVHKLRHGEQFDANDYGQEHHDAVVHIQAAIRGSLSRKKANSVEPFQFAVGGHIFRHSGSKSKSKLQQKRAKAAGPSTKRRVQVDHDSDDTSWLFDMFDKDEDGILTPEDLQAAFESLSISSSVMPPEKIQEMIMEADLDQDGVVSRDDFMEYMHQVQLFTKEEKEMARKRAIAKSGVQKATVASRRNMVVQRLHGLRGYAP